MVTKTIPAIVVIAAAAALMTTATLLPSTMTVTPAFAEAQEKESICHRPPGNPENAHRITVGQPAAENHLDQHEEDGSSKKCKG